MNQTSNGHCRGWELVTEEESGMTLLSVVSWSLEDYLATWDTLGSKHS